MNDQENKDIAASQVAVCVPSENGLRVPFNPLERWDNSEARLQAMRNGLRNVLDSYQGTFDFLIEPVQNAVDEVEYRFILEELASPEKAGAPVVSAGYEPSIWVIVNAHDNTVSVLDNGLGMDREQMHRLVYPSYTEKRQKSQAIRRTLRGHKGVGTSFLCYGFNYFRVSTKGREGFLSMELKGGRRWVFSDASNPEPSASPAKEDLRLFTALSSGTAVTVQLDQSTQPHSIARLGASAERWALNLRLHTALGFVDLRNDQRLQSRLKVFLVFIDKEGGESTQQVEPTYLFPHTIPGYDWLDLAKFYREHTESVVVPNKCQDMDGVYRIWEGEDLVHPKNGPLRGLGFDELLSKEPVIYAVFTHSSRLWDTMSESLTQDKRIKVFRPGVSVVSSNAIVGRPIAVEPTYGAGNVDRLLLLADLRNARPDLGRKGFDPRLEQQIRKAAENVMAYFVARRKPFLKPAGVEPGESHRRLDLYLKLKKSEERQAKSPLDIGLSLVVEPENEPEVIDMFGELLGLRILLGYRQTGGFHSGTYDLVLRYKVLKEDPRISYDPKTNPLGLAPNAFGGRYALERPPFIGEFKVSLDGLVEEMGSKEEAKNFDEMDLVVCWSVGSRWKREYDLLEFGEDVPVSKREFFGATHILSRKGINDGHAISVIALRKVANLIADGLINVPSRNQS